MNYQQKAWVIVYDNYEHTDIFAVVKGTEEQATLIAGNYREYGHEPYPKEIQFFDYTEEAS